MTSTFQRAITFTTGLEGGFVDNPNDHGGATNHGVTFQTLKDAAARLHGHSHDPVFDGEITVDTLKSLTPQEVEDVILVEGYWPDAFDEIAPVLAIKTFDFGFNMGLRSGVKLLQTAVNTAGVALPVDGALGPQSVRAIRQLDPSLLLSHLIAAAKAHYQAIVAHNPSQSVFLKGWLRRAEALPAPV